MLITAPGQQGNNWLRNNGSQFDNSIRQSVQFLLHGQDNRSILITAVPAATSSPDYSFKSANKNPITSRSVAVQTVLVSEYQMSFDGRLL